MKLLLIVGGVLVAIGVAALVYKGFNYTAEETVLQIGSLKATAQTEKTFFIPGWAGVSAVVVGVLAIIVGMRR